MPAGMIDLHTHSNVSDGTDTPARVAELAAEAGCRAFALTDHDRLDGQEEAGRRAAALGVDLVPGCEISCAWESGTFHLLVYFVEPGDHPLGQALVDLQRVRSERNAVMVGRLRELGLPITLEEVESEGGGTGVGRPHMAAVLVRHGAAASIDDAFGRWLSRGRPGYVGKRRLGVAEAVRLAGDSGGVAVVAHPLSLGLGPAGLDAAVADLAGLGLGGIEAHYGRYGRHERAGLAELARRHGLVATGGSDHHGAYKPDLTVGRGTGDLDVPDSALRELEGRRP